jgi:lipid-A-disaccharide synthase
MKYYLIAGERSGDLHGSNLIKAIKQQDPTAEFRAWGGDMMQAAGAEIVMHYGQMAFMGFVEVLMNLFTILGFISKCKKDILAYQPDVVILIDYAGFNMRIAQFAKQNKIRTFYYISPKVWAWNQNRALKIKRFVDKMFVIFPFEQSFFKKFDYDVDYVGNPLFDAISDFNPNSNFLKDNNINTTKPIIALLPGSRKQEVEEMLKLMLSVKNHFFDYQFVIAGVSNLPKELYQKMIDSTDVYVVFDSAYHLLSVASAALVTSGTATLETALFRVPQVVCYKAGTISYQIAKWLIRVPYISLVNLIADKEVVKELIQNELTTQNLIDELGKIIIDGDKRNTILDSYTQIINIMGKKGASEHAGKLMVQYLTENGNITA